MKNLIIVWLLACCIHLNAQEVNFNGAVYLVKGDTILKDGIDVTNTLNIEEQQSIRSTLEKIEEQEEVAEKKEKELKKAEKEQKKAENKQKSAEKALKKREKAHSNFEKSGKKYEDAISKYEKLKKKGKLSPEDEGKWLKKIDKLKEANEKTKRKLN